MSPTLSKITVYHPGPKACENDPLFKNYPSLDFVYHTICASTDQKFQKLTRVILKICIANIFFQTEAMYHSLISTLSTFFICEVMFIQPI